VSDLVLAKAAELLVPEGPKRHPSWPPDGDDQLGDPDRLAVVVATLREVGVIDDSHPWELLR
jgi:hypothetical protein